MLVEQQLVGHYRIQKQLGCGSNGDVYLVVDSRSNQQVVFRLFQVGQDGLAYATGFVQQAKTLMDLFHPYVLPILDYGEVSFGGVLQPYIVTPYCSQGTLEDWLAMRGSPIISPYECASLVLQMVSAVQAAHDRNLLHLQLQPASFFLQRQSLDVPNLLLEGIGIAPLARAMRGNGENLPANPAYIAPEQWRDLPGPASDQYAIAVMSYQMLTGRLPFEDNAEEARKGPPQITPPPPGLLNPELSKAIDAVVMRGMATYPNDRYPNVAAMGAAFEQVLHALVLPGSMGMPEYSQSGPDDIPGTTNSGEQVEKKRKLSWPVLILSALLALSLIGIGAYLITQNVRSVRDISIGATAQATLARGNQLALATAQAQSTINGALAATAFAQGTAQGGTLATAQAQLTAQVGGTATANAQFVLDATATAQSQLTPTPTLLPSPTPIPFEGTWKNIDPNSNGITRMVVTSAGSMISVHPYAKCSTGECDWGIHSAAYTGTPFTIYTNHDNQREQLTLSTLENGDLQVTDVGTGGKVNTYAFRKSS